MESRSRYGHKKTRKPTKYNPHPVSFEEAIMNEENEEAENMRYHILVIVTHIRHKRTAGHL